MPANDPDERSLISSIANHARWARVGDRAAQTAAARARLWTRFLDEVDPDRVLDPDERERRALSARKAYYARLTLKSLQARRAKAAARREAQVDAPPGPLDPMELAALLLAGLNEVA